jgi:hypothetical protein
MQEASPHTPSEDHPHRKRFIIVGCVVLLILACGILIIIDIVSRHDGWLDKSMTATVTRFAVPVVAYIALIIRYAMPYLKKLRAAAKIEELLPEFIQASDHFTRPKHFVHKALIGDTESEGAERFIRELGAYSDGSVKTPELARPTEKKPHTRYRVIFNVNDKIFSIYSSEKVIHMNEMDGNGHDYMSMLDLTHKFQREELGVIHVRIAPIWVNQFSGVEANDFTLEGIKLEAFLKTLELSRQFNINPAIW